MINVDLAARPVGKLTMEHVWPQRMAGFFPDLKLAKHQRGDTPTAEPLDTWDAPAFNTQVSIDCQRCNNVLLRQIEDEAMDFVKPMALADGIVTLRPSAQQKLAGFALRMIAVGQYTNPTARPVPRSHREHLVQHRAPPPQTEVWAWGYDGAQVFSPRLMALGAEVGRTHELLPPRCNAYRGILRFGRLAFEVAARYDQQSFPFIPAERDAYLRVWPIDFNRVLVWPPKQTLTDDGWDARVDALATPIII